MSFFENIETFLTKEVQNTNIFDSKYQKIVILEKSTHNPSERVTIFPAKDGATCLRF